MLTKIRYNMSPIKEFVHKRNSENCFRKLNNCFFVVVVVLIYFAFIISYMQLDESNANRLVLRSITAETAGRFRCEVSAEAPSFETVSGHADMTVVRKCRYFVLFFIALFFMYHSLLFFPLFFSLLHQCAHYRPLSLTSSFISSRFFCSAIFGRLL